MYSWYNRDPFYRQHIPTGVLPNYAGLPVCPHRRVYNHVQRWHQHQLLRPTRLWVPVLAPSTRLPVQTEHVNRSPEGSDPFDEFSDTTLTSSNGGRGLAVDSVFMSPCQKEPNDHLHWVNYQHLRDKTDQLDSRTLTANSDVACSKAVSAECVRVETPTPSFTLDDNRSLDSHKLSHSLCASRSVLKITLAFCVSFLLALIVVIIYMEVDIWQK